MTEPAEGSLLEGDPQTTPPEGNWYGDEFAETVTQKGWKEPGDVLKSYVDLEKSMGSKIKMPTPESSAEEIRAFYQKSGCPENPDGYEITGLPEEMPQFLRYEAAEKELAQVAYDQGVSKQAFETLVKKFYEKSYADLLATKEQGEAALRQDFGDKYDENLSIANRFFDSCSPEFCEVVKATGLANNPVFIKEFLTKGKATMPDTLIKGDAADVQTDDYTPQYVNSPEQYEGDNSPEGQKAKAWFKANKNIDIN